MRLDTLIIGSGITAAFTAYLLALEGICPVVLGCDKDYPPASFVNPGGLNPLHGPGIPGPMADFSQAAYQLHLEHWEQIQKLSGIDFQGRIVQRLFPALTAEDEQNLATLKQFYQDTPGFSAHWLTLQELHQLEPRLSPTIRGGLLTKGNATVSSQRYVQALLQAAQAKGAHLIQDQALNLELSPTAIRIPLAGGSVLSAAQVILATGAWTTLWPDLSPASLKPVKGDLLKIALRGEPLPFDLTYGPDGIYHIDGHQYWLGGSQRQVGFDFSLSQTEAQAITARMNLWLPSLSEAFQLLDHCTALRPVTPDGLPLLGRLDDPRVIGVSGAGPKGMLWSAGLAAGVLQLLQNKTFPEAKRFDPLRFKIGGPDGGI